MTDSASDNDGNQQNAEKMPIENPPELLLSTLPEKERKIATAAVQITSEQFEGPIPPPRIIQDYERLIPGSGNRIITMAENQQSHRQRLETAVVESNLRRERQGMYLGFVLALALLMGGIATILAGKDIIGVTLIAGEAGLLAVTYLRALHQGRIERKEQRERLQKPRAATAKQIGGGTPKPKSRRSKKR
jgi:uncharacterized membrane protein